MQLPTLSRTINNKQETENSKKFLVSSLKFKVRCGFTLIELLVVMSIIAILIASATYSWQNAQQKGRDGKRKSDLKAAQQALETYFQTNGKYPPDNNKGKIKCEDGSVIDWGATFSCAGTLYLRQLPKDPTNITQAGIIPYYYDRDPTNNIIYILSTKLENANDPEKQLNCNSSAPNHNYCVKNP